MPKTRRQPLGAELVGKWPKTTSTLYTKDASERTDNEQQVITILETLNIEESNRSQFLQKLEQDLSLFWPIQIQKQWC